MNGLIETDSIFTLKLSKSIFFLSENQSTSVDNGIIYIQINDDEPIMMDKYIYYEGIYTSDKRLKAGDKCKFWGEAENFTSVWSEITVVPKAHYEILSYTTDGLTGKIKIRIHDPEDIDMCYRLYVNSYFYVDRNERRAFESSSYYSSNDKLLNQSDDLFESYISDYFNDEYFHSSYYDLEVSIDYPLRSYYYGDSDKSWEKDPENRQTLFSLDINLQAISRDLYLYYCTWDASYNNDFGMFSEPIQIYSNFNEGIGCFGSIHNNTTIIYRDDKIWEEYMEVYY